jgi:hypothetical protein
MEHRIASSAVITPRRASRRSGRHESAEAAFVLAPTVSLILGAWNRELHSERDLIEYTLAFINGETDRRPLLRALESGEFVDTIFWWQDTPEYPHAPETLGKPGFGKFITDPINSSRIRGLLHQLVSESKEAERFFVDRAPALMTGIRLVPLALKGNTGISLRVQTHISDMAGFEAYLSLLLLDAERELGGALCRCRYQECGKYFLAASHTGRTRRMYCTPEHTQLAHNASAAERMAKLRKSRKNPKLRKRK